MHHVKIPCHIESTQNKVRFYSNEKLMGKKIYTYQGTYQDMTKPVD
ncbi:MAG: hypothetical protein JWR61_4794 [Ferruginibacter sp.]|nr:hypothetical protein [Ferruginibacter sp.]